VPEVGAANGAGDGAGPVVGVIGLGSIGDGVATSVTRAGLPLVVCDLRTEATDRHRDTATVAGSPAELVGQSDVVVVAVVDDAQVHGVLSGPDGGLAAAGPDTTVVIVSTISLPCVRAIGSEAAALGVPVIDCGVSGGPGAAATGELVCMVTVSDPQVGGASRLMFRSTVAPFTDADDKGLVGAMQAAAHLAHKDLAAALELAGSLDVELPLARMTEDRTDQIFGVGGAA